MRGLWDWDLGDGFGLAFLLHAEELISANACVFQAQDGEILAGVEIRARAWLFDLADLCSVDAVLLAETKSSINARAELCFEFLILMDAFGDIRGVMSRIEASWDGLALEGDLVVVFVRDRDDLLILINIEEGEVVSFAKSTQVRE